MGYEWGQTRLVCHDSSRFSIAALGSELERRLSCDLAFEMLASQQGSPDGIDLLHN